MNYLTYPKGQTATLIANFPLDRETRVWVWQFEEPKVISIEVKIKADDHYDHDAFI